MDWSNFDKSYRLLKNVLRDLISNGKNDHKLDVYGSYLNYGDEIKIIIGRIEEEIQGYMKLSREISEIARTREEPSDKLLDVFLEYHSLIRLDIKSFFIFTRIFLDTLARIVTLSFSKIDKDLPSKCARANMRKLVRDEKLMELDPDFAKGLKARMSWMDTFVERRIEFEHCLGSIRRYTITGDGKFGFDIQGTRSDGKWGTDVVDSMTEYMKEVLSNLSEVISYIHNNRFRLPTSAR